MADTTATANQSAKQKKAAKDDKKVSSLCQFWKEEGKTKNKEMGAISKVSFSLLYLYYSLFSFYQRRLRLLPGGWLDGLQSFRNQGTKYIYCCQCWVICHTYIIQVSKVQTSSMWHSSISDWVTRASMPVTTERLVVHGEDTMGCQLKQNKILVRAHSLSIKKKMVPNHENVCQPPNISVPVVKCSHYVYVNTVTAN